MMRTFFVFIALVSFWLPSPQTGSVFVPAKVTSAGGITFPANSATTGIVTLAVNLDAMGNQQNIDVLRDLPSLTSVALAAIKTWVFAPAKLDGHCLTISKSQFGMLYSNNTTTSTAAIRTAAAIAAILGTMKCILNHRSPGVAG
jgi:Gram-negative bacterial TonB protein C-terminal